MTSHLQARCHACYPIHQWQITEGLNVTSVLKRVCFKTISCKTCFNCRLVLTECIHWWCCRTIRSGISRPNVQQIIVSTASQVLAIRRPLQAADFLLVCCEWTNVVICHSYVVMVNEATSRTTTTIMHTHHPLHSIMYKQPSAVQLLLVCTVIECTHIMHYIP